MLLLHLQRFVCISLSCLVQCCLVIVQVGFSQLLQGWSLAILPFETALKIFDLVNLTLTV